MRMRLPPAALVVIAVVIALPAGASAATVRVRTTVEEVPKGAPVTHSEVLFVAAPGEANRVTVTDEPNAVLFHDEGADVGAGEGCSSIDARTVRCPRPAGSIWSTEVTLADMDDTASAPGAGLTQVSGGPGNDVIDTDVARGDEGDDTLTGGPGTSNLFGGPGEDRLSAGGGHDRLAGGPGADVLDGDDGADTASWEERTENISVDLADPGPDGASGEGDTLVEIENVRTGSGADFIRGDGGQNALDAGFGGANDTVIGGAGDDVLSAGDGDDQLMGEDGADQLADSFGRDRLLGGNGDDLLELGLDSDGGDVAQCDTGRDVARDPQRGDLVLGDCEAVQLDLFSIVAVTPLASPSTRTIPFRVVQGDDAERECGTLRLGKRPGQSGRLDFTMPPTGRRRTVRVPVKGSLRTLLAAGNPVNLYVRFEVREGRCSARLLRRGPDETGAYRYQLGG